MTPLLILLSLPAQPPTDKPAPPNPAAELSEDVEVMRVLLTRAVSGSADDATAALYRRTRYDAGDRAEVAYFLSAGQPAAPVAKFDGLPLKGYGAVFTLSFQTFGVEPGVPARSAALLETCQKCHDPTPFAAKVAAAGPAAARAEWDRVRDEVRGAAPPPPAETLALSDVCYPGRMAEAIVAALAKNGRHLRHLKPDELVTVSVSNDGHGTPAGVGQLPLTGRYMFPLTRYVPHTENGVTHYRPVTSNTYSKAEADPHTIPAPVIPSAAANSPAAESTPQQVTPSTPPGGGLAQSRSLGFTEDESRSITLGELHLRQDNPKEAVEALKKALARHGLGKVDLPPNTSSDMARKIGESVGMVRRKLAQALVAAGEGEEAKKWIDAGDAVLVAHPPAAKPAAPARLTITVKKKDLDEADALGPEGFRKRLTIEATGYPTPKKK